MSHFPMNMQVIERRAALFDSAKRNATVPVPHSIVNYAEEMAALSRPVGNPERLVYGTAGKVLNAARLISETTSFVLIARQRLADKGGVADSALSTLDKELDQVEEMIRVMRDQLNAAREDRFDAQDAKSA